jgi:hypothetical protein
LILPADFGAGKETEILKELVFVTPESAADLPNSA